MLVRLSILAALLVACDSGEPPDILGLADQVAVVGQQLVLELNGVDPDGERLDYSVQADIALHSNATITQTPGGTGLFKWTPIASDVGAHVFDFTVSDGDHETTVSITIDVRSGVGAPIFRQPLGSGTVINLKATPCATISILVEDADTTEVTIAQEPPQIAGAQLTQLDGTTASWQWCPTQQQVGANDRYTLVLSADDGDNPKTIKDYVIVIGTSTLPTLVINEVDYDNVGTDSAEYVELFNPSMNTASLAGIQLVLVNGATNADYAKIDLTSVGSLGAGKYLVIAGASVTVPSSAKKLDPLWAQDQVQNGAPDGMAIVDSVTHAVIDALSYEGAIAAASITDFPAPVSLVEGTALATAVADSNTVSGTLCRFPNGHDSNNANADWVLCSSLSVGTANVH